MQMLVQRRSSSLRKRLSSLGILLIAGVVVVFVLIQGISLPLHSGINEAATFSGTLLLAIGVVVVANYLSAGKRHKAGPPVEVGYDQNVGLDL